MRKANELYHDINIEIAERLSDYAKEKGLSMGQLSKQLGYSRTYIYQILRGKRNFSMKAFCELMEKTETTASLNVGTPKWATIPYDRKKEIAKRQLERELARLFNKYSVDNDLNVPDFLLARSVLQQLDTLKDLNAGLWKHKFGATPGYNKHPATTADRDYTDKIEAALAAERGE